jgi:hypothetical protein
MNYKFSTDELIELQLIASGTEIASDPEGIVTFTGVPQGIRGKLNVFRQAQKSILELLRDISLNPVKRTNRYEQILLTKSSEDYAAAYRAICMVERIRLLYSSVGSPFPRLYKTTRSMVRQRYFTTVMQWTYLYLTGEAEKVAKFQSVSMFNKVMNVEPLESIDLPFGWCVGSLTPWGSMHRRVYRILMKSSLGEKLRLAQCFLYFKKGCPKASKSFVKESLIKHEKALTKTAPLVETLSYKDKDKTIVVPRTVIKERISDIVYDVFKNYKEPQNLWEPSRHASYHTKQTKGGQMGEVNFTSEGWNWQFTSKGWQYAPISCDHYDYFDTGYEFIKVPRVVLPTVKVTKDIFARPVPLTEPLKVRVITCENAWSTYLLTGAQKSLWECLHNHHWFALTGRPVVASDIPELPKGSDWISVDYSAATDNLSSDFSRLVIREICDLTGLPFELCLDSLVNHKLDYKGRLVDQTNGQLMGSILSFIVLCICNAVVISLTVSNKFDRNAPFLVNGDDGLFIGGETEYQTWKSLSSSLGLSPSIGKVYRSNRFCVINSECFYLNEDDLVVDCPYPNASGLMTFDARTYSKAKSPLDLRDNLILWLKGFSTYEEKVQAERLWYSMLSPILKESWVVNFNVDYYLPQSLGGLGLPLPLFRQESFVRREALARARWCLDCGEPYKFKPAKVLKNGEAWKKASFTNPFLEKDTWVRCISTRTVTKSAEEALKSLGWSKPVEIVPEEVEEYDYLSSMRNSSRGGSSVAISALCGVDSKEASRCLESKVRDFKSGLIALRKRSDLKHYWYNQELISSDSFQYLRFIRGGRKTNSWAPSIPPFDPVLGRNYSKMLELVQEFRHSDACVMLPSRDSKSLIQ